MALQGTDKNAQSQTAGATGNNQMAEAMQNARSQATGSTGGQQQARPQGNAGAAGGNRGGFSWRRMGSLIPAPMGRTPQSEVLTRLQKAIENIYKNNTNPTYEVTAMPIDMNQDLNLSMSVLVIAARDVNNAGLGVAYHVLLIEGSTEPFSPRFENIMGQNVEVQRVASDAFDERLVKTVQEYLRRQFPRQDIFPADGEVVPRDFNLDDEGLLFQLAANAAYAVTHELEMRRPDFHDVNLADASKEDTLVVRVAFPKNQNVNAVGLPVRNDVSIDLTAVAANQSQAQAQLERQALVARAGGFVDLIWDPEAPVNQQYYYGAPQPANFHRYAARFVMTGLESVAASTLPAQLVALVSGLSLRENNAWVQAFRPAPFSGAEVDLHDIGAIGIEVNFENNANGIGARIDTKADNFKPDSLAKLVAATIKPGLVISLDVEECGPSTWYNGAFAAAAAGNSGANAAIIEAANYLTNGAFAKHFPSNGRVCTDENNLIHLGYYTDRSGQKKDIREIDYLAILNLVGEKDPEVIKDWSDTFNKTQFPLLQRLAARKRIIQALFSDTVFTGFARRVTFEAQFLNALAAACLECGLDIRSVTPYADVGSYERAGASFVQGALLNPNATGLFNRGYQGGYQGQAAGQWANRAAGYNSRW